MSLDNDNTMNNIDTPISLEQIKCMIKDLYLIDVIYIKPLNGYDDKNFEIYCNSCGSKFILKITNRIDSENIPVIEAQNELMFFLAKKNLPVPVPLHIRNKEDIFYSLFQFNENDQRIVRLLTYQKGIPLANLTITDPKHSIFSKVGQLVALVNIHMQDFYHVGYSFKKSIWNLEEMPLIKQYIEQTLSNKYLEKKIVEDVIKEFQDKVMLKAYSKLTKQIIHGDINQHNILIFSITENPDISSLLDFADSHFSCSFFDVAIASAYMAVYVKSIDCIPYLLAGFQTIKPISQIESEIFKICIEARLCQSLVLGLYTHKKKPNNKYVLNSQINGWKILKQLRKMTEFEFQSKFINTSLSH